MIQQEVQGVELGTWIGTA